MDPTGHYKGSGWEGKKVPESLGSWDIGSVSSSAEGMGFLKGEKPP